MAQINTNELKAWLKRAGMIQTDLAAALGINPSTLNRKINDESGEALTVSEANEICRVLRIPRSAAPAIFFNYRLTKTQV